MYWHTSATFLSMDLSAEDYCLNIYPPYQLATNFITYDLRKTTPLVLILILSYKRNADLQQKQVARIPIRFDETLMKEVV